MATEDLDDKTNFPVASQSITVLNQDDISLLDVSVFHVPLMINPGK